MELGRIVGGALRSIDGEEEVSETAYIIRKHKFQLHELLNDSYNTTPDDLHIDVLKASADNIYSMNSPYDVKYTAEKLYSDLMAKDAMVDLFDEIVYLLDSNGKSVGGIKIHPDEMNAELTGPYKQELDHVLTHHPTGTKHLIDYKSYTDYLKAIQAMEEGLLKYAFSAEMYYRKLLKKLQDANLGDRN
jgi:hypothetical protein